MEREDFFEAVKFLSEKDPGVAIFDSDYTIRRPGEGRLGEISSEVMGRLRRLKNLGWELLFVSNQPKRGHQIARAGAKRKGHYFFPDSLEEEFGADRVFGGGADFLVKHFKKTDQAVMRVSGKVKEVLAGNKRSVWMVGDRQADEEFFNEVLSKLRDQGVNTQAGFIKLPDSVVVKLANKIPGAAGLVEKVMP